MHDSDSYNLDSYKIMLAAVQAFWDKMKKLDERKSKMINGRIRVSEFRDVD